MPSDSLAGTYSKDIPVIPIIRCYSPSRHRHRWPGPAPAPVNTMETRMLKQLAASGVTHVGQISRGNKRLKRFGPIGASVAYEH